MAPYIIILLDRLNAGEETLFIAGEFLVFSKINIWTQKVSCWLFCWIISKIVTDKTFGTNNKFGSGVKRI